ncbi:DUF2149 domain-containing protein [Desulfosporosinus shakirovi]|uniref:DUF2149 domain-containing protein n=1 Tax=Desulfosporosinus shakirovi TaxID=2885154 RepID=UPI001E411AFC|nr:DUF2149 domain-containing protein [Desulfosporosinus sp. SRJS8]MCB8818497.1 DUF2149 domain-containing protein [Desulfosporosinus sp. SRJS8]
MIRTGSLSGRPRSRLHKEEINPLDGIVNLVDAMLVFACGLMLSIILYWGVDINNKVTDVIDQEDLVEVENKDLQEAVKDGTLGKSFNAKGMVYEDPKTGKMYILSK